MILLYTGAEKPNFPQKVSDLSLGGWVSNSTVPNNFLSNLFGKIGQDDLINKVVEVRAIALKNITGNTVTNVQLYTVTPDTSLSSLKIAVVQPNIDPICSAPYFEQIPSGEALPYYADFQSCEGSEAALTISSIANGAVVGIWIMRTINDNAAASAADTSCATIISNFKNPPSAPPVEDIIQMIISF